MKSVNGQFTALLLGATLCINPAQATILDMEVDWDHSFLFAGSGGLENPLLRVAFNPQPEPPAGGLLTMGTPPNPAYPPDPVITHSGDFTAGAPFRVLFGIANGMDLNIMEGSFARGPDDGLLEFDVLGALGVKVFDVELEFSTTSGGATIDWVAFNPQPEPPAIGPGGAAFGADLSFNSFSDVSLAFRVHDAAGGIITLTRVVPEPGSLVLLGAGIGLLGYSWRTGPGGAGAKRKRPA